MSTEDIYVRALTSKSLRPFEHRPTDIDVVIAAGWVKESNLATMLYRLRAEFDAVRSDLKLRMKQPRDNLGRVKTNGLRGFTESKQALLNYIVALAYYERIDIRTVDLDATTDRVLDHLLSPVCDRCNGVKFKLVPGTGRLSAQACDPPPRGGCGGSGIRSLRFTRSTRKEEMHLVRVVLAEVERKMDHVNSRISAYLKQHHHPRKKK